MFTWQRFLAFSKVNHLKNGVFMQEFLRNLLIYVLFYAYCAFFCELCDFSWIVWSDAIYAKSHHRVISEGLNVDLHSWIIWSKTFIAIELRLLSALIVSSSIAMEKVNLGYSMKNIALPSRSKYVRNFIEKTEHFLRQMRWKAYHFVNSTESTTKETYGDSSQETCQQELASWYQSKTAC